MTKLPGPSQIRELGTEPTPELLERSRVLYEPFHEREPYAGVGVIRDVHYGSHERHRLDVFHSAAAPNAPVPVLVFVHGGGFVGGDKKLPGSPYQDNVALWAVRHGMVGINITYRLAPEHTWPAGAEDVGAAMRWVRENVDGYGGDVSRIFLMGTSAGAAHVASFVADVRFHADSEPGIAGAVLVSGIYNRETAPPSRGAESYFGTDRSKYAEQSPIHGLIETEVPLMIVLAEYDPYMFQQQALELINRLFERNRQFPRFIRLMGHNHFTSVRHLNTADDYFGRQIERFVAESG